MADLEQMPNLKQQMTDDEKEECKLSFSAVVKTAAY